MDNAAHLQQDALQKLHIVLLDMLSEIDRICRKNKITYSLIGGTLLGAVRHGGFIPWDDDVDVFMMRDEYIKFREACINDLDSTKYFLQDSTSDSDYRWGYSKLRRKDSEFVRVGQEHMKMKTGIFIDIFIGDNVPDFYPIRLIHAFYCFILRKILYAQTGYISSKSFITRNIYRLLYIIPASFSFKRLETLAKRYNKKTTKYIRSLTFPTPKGGRFGFLSRWYTKTMDIDFEGRQFRTICDYKEYLEFKYGDYMQVPSITERQWHPASILRLPDNYQNYYEQQNEH